jgi:NAD-dependent deacetylase
LPRNPAGNQRTTIRDALNGLWGRFDPAQLATPEAFDADPALVWGW